ncbi:adenylate/guanylate cyclase domain-containing protein [Alicyclobacillus ferrooxydans]|uniref:Guanylate cyclase n=1 Tax=Alicyclobacillus ferrooxydans TaxID=471514 RepID=A0A0P9D0Q9_9BACL|nr:adenylate/guanylate cyclase domain-containing protein [Alicyclobacillus ferrooxydans]KPV45665.1 guanylate cyclase [Alicyclobacillus ferrooxydans]
MSFSMTEAKRLVKEHFDRARGKMLMAKSMTDSFKMAEPISDVVPGYHAKEMEFGDYEKDNYTALFIDIRNSTKRAHRIGAEKTFLSLHAFFPGVAYTIEEFGGYVMDFMGDGVMAFFGGKESEMNKSWAAQQAGTCGLKLIDVVQNAVNPVLKDGGIDWLFQCGVGIDHGSVVVTKIGTYDNYDVKAFGDCINKASKYSDGTDSVVVSQQIKDLWPTSEGGKMRFHKLGHSDGYEVRREE